jgi:chromosome partitioning protein
LWATNRKLPFLGSLRNSPSYVQCIEQGITIFDLPKDNVSQDLAQWKPILDWLQPVLFPMPAIQDKTLNGSAAIYMGRNKALVERLQQPHPPLTAAGRDIGSRVSDESSQPATWGEPVSQEKKGDFIGSMGLPNFLRRK